MIESLSLEEENIIKDIWNVFRLEKETKAIRDYKRLIFEHKKEEVSYYTPVRVSNFLGNNWIQN